MPTNKLEDFILQNRTAFDDETPGDHLWDQIERAIEATDGTDDTDPLESFVTTHRTAFDDVTPPLRLEGRLFAALDEAKLLAQATAGASPMPPLRAILGQRGQRLRVLGVAAAFLLLIFAAFAVGTSRGYRAAEEEQMADQLRLISPELVETEDYYRREIATQATKVKLVNHDPQLQEDLAAIDVATEEIRASLLEVPASQRAALIDRLIETYRTKLNILLRIQEHLPDHEYPSSTTTQQTTNES